MKLELIELPSQLLRRLNYQPSTRRSPSWWKFLQVEWNFLCGQALVRQYMRYLASVDPVVNGWPEDLSRQFYWERGLDTLDTNKIFRECYQVRQSGEVAMNKIIRDHYQKYRDSWYPGMSRQV